MHIRQMSQLGTYLKHFKLDSMYHFINMVKYRVAIWSFLKLTALYFTMSDIVHSAKFFFCQILPNKKSWEISLYSKSKQTQNFHFLAKIGLKGVA